MPQSRPITWRAPALLAVLSFAVAACVALAPAPPAGARAPSAERLVKRGHKAYAAQRFDDAVASYRAALELEPDRQGLLFNIGVCRERQGRLADAVAAYRGYLQARPQAPNRQDVLLSVKGIELKLGALARQVTVVVRPAAADARVTARWVPSAGRGEPEALARTATSYAAGPVAAPHTWWLPLGTYDLQVEAPGFVASKRRLALKPGAAQLVELALVRPDAPGAVTLRGAPAGAGVEVDGAPGGQTPLAEPLRLAPGPHTVTLTAEGFEPRRLDVKVAPGASLDLDAALTPLPRASLRPGGQTESGISGAAQAGGSGGLATGGWVVGGAGAASLATGAVFWGLAASSAADARAYGHSADRVEEQYNDRVARADDQALVGNIAAGVGAGLVVAGAVMILLDDGDDGGDGAASGPEPRAAQRRGGLGLAPLPGGAAALWMGAF